jgi:hypothetical protein
MMREGPVINSEDGSQQLIQQPAAINVISRLSVTSANGRTRATILGLPTSTFSEGLKLAKERIYMTWSCRKTIWSRIR